MSHKTVHLSTDVSFGCPECSHFFKHEELGQNIDHLINEHGYELRHVGQQTDRDGEGNIWHQTVAVLTKP
jgi:hypothetical protein